MLTFVLSDAGFAALPAMPSVFGLPVRAYVVGILPCLSFYLIVTSCTKPLWKRASLENHMICRENGMASGSCISCSSPDNMKIEKGPSVTSALFQRAPPTARSVYYATMMSCLVINHGPPRKPHMRPHHSYGSMCQCSGADRSVGL